MTIRVFVILLSLIALGVLLLWLGLRGRRLNRNPCCRQCGFDLSGVLPAGVTCTECGAGVKLARFVRIGQRRRMPLLLALGAPLATLPFIPLGLVLFTTLTRTDLARFKPVSLLLWEARTLSESDVRAAGKELLARQRRGELSSRDYAELVRTSLQLQASPGPWSTEWGEIFQQARLDGRADSEATATFRSNSAVLNWSVPPSAHAGSDVNVQCDIIERRNASTLEDTEMWVGIERVTLGDRVLIEDPLPDAPAYGVTDRISAGPLGPTRFGSTNLFATTSASTVTLQFTLPFDLTPGEYTLTLSTALQGRPDLFLSNGLFQEPSRWTRGRQTLTIRVVEDQVPLAELIPASEATSAFILAALKPEWDLCDSPAPNQSKDQIVIRLKSRPFVEPLCHTLAFKAAGVTTPLGLIINQRNDTNISPIMPAAAAQVHDETFVLYANLPRELLGVKGELVLTPSLKDENATRKVTKIYNGTLTIPNVQFGKPAELTP